MIIRRSAERGFADHGWLRSFHTFSFADYYDPEQLGFGALRVLNEDRVAPGRGFGMHPHKDMEIISYVLDGALQHRDSMGSGGAIRPGDVQRMSAGSGVSHSELNASQTAPVHFLQIWIVPEAQGIEPSYQQAHFPASEREGKLRLVASRDGRDRSVIVHQDVDLYATLLDPEQRVRHEVRPARRAFVHVARGKIALDGTSLEAGDAALLSDAGTVELVGMADSVGKARAELLLFDLA
jgi:quercetin 2,3-dioxygenase